MTAPTQKSHKVVVISAEMSAGSAAIEGSPLEPYRPTVIDWREGNDDRSRTLAKEGSDAEAIIVSPWYAPTSIVFDRDRWEAMPQLRVIAGTFDHRYEPWLDLPDALERGIAVVDTSRSMTPTVAEFALAMTLNLLRDIPNAVATVRSGGWLRSGWDPNAFVSGDLTGRRVALAGFGSIARRYRELLMPFDCSVEAYDPYVSAAELAKQRVRKASSLTALAEDAEIFVVGIPPTPSTIEVISRQVIDALPQGSALVLVTRMAVVDQAALWRRIKKGEIRAAVDVWEPEPVPPDAWFRSSPYVMPTPHIAGNIALCHRRCFLTACQDAVNVLNGRPAVYASTVRDSMIYDASDWTG